MDVALPGTLEWEAPQAEREGRLPIAFQPESGGTAPLSTSRDVESVMASMSVSPETAATA